MSRWDPVENDRLVFVHCGLVISVWIQQNTEQKLHSKKSNEWKNHNFLCVEYEYKHVCAHVISPPRRRKWEKGNCRKVIGLTLPCHQVVGEIIVDFHLWFSLVFHQYFFRGLSWTIMLALFYEIDKEMGGKKYIIGLLCARPSAGGRNYGQFPSLGLTHLFSAIPIDYIFHSSFNINFWD